MNVDLEELAAIIEQLDKTEFSDFQYEHGDLRIRVRRGGHYDPAPMTIVDGHDAAATAATAPVPPVASAPESARQTEGTPRATNPESSNGGAPNISLEAVPAGHVVVTAPMLGTYYGAPKPGEPPFVQLGDAVSADAVLCIVEVMKLMNSVSAGTDGEVSAIFVQDGDLVEFGQPLFAIRAAS